jgi:RNA polymerase sigma factor (sigma-70 family)
MRNETGLNDLMQEIFLRFSRVDQGALVRQPDAYLFGIAWRVVSSPRTKVCEEGRTLGPHTFDQLNVREGPTGNGAEIDAMIDDLRTQLRRKLSELPVAYRDVLTLHVESDLTCSEIARQLGLSVRTVKKYLLSAKMRLRDVLA